VLLGEIIENRGTTMDFMFEDDVDEVGSDVEAYCPKCKADTTHVVISKYEDEIRRVQCNPCGDVHSFRKPRGEAEEDMPEPVAARKRALLKKQTWEEFFAKHGERNAKPYEFRDTYRENAIVFHPKFGKGYVSEVVSESKVEITFSDARRILVHNRKDIPGSPVGREDDGLPSTAVPVKGVKGTAKAAEKKAVDKSAVKPTLATKADVTPKAPAKKSEDKKPEDKKAPAKKPADKHVAAKKAPTPKKAAEAKKPVAKKPVAKKPVAKKLAAQTPAKKKSK
jgi:Zn ribbon nucleic-acid-binding protein